MWRPNDWKNPYPKYIHEHTDYEDGADAMLEALKKHFKEVQQKITKLFEKTEEIKNRPKPSP